MCECVCVFPAINEFVADSQVPFARSETKEIHFCLCALDKMRSFNFIESDRNEYNMCRENF